MTGGPDWTGPSGEFRVWAVLADRRLIALYQTEQAAEHAVATIPAPSPVDLDVVPWYVWPEAKRRLGDGTDQ